MRLPGADMEAGARYDRIYWAGLSLLVVATAVLMCYLAATTSLWLDEVFQVEYCRTSSLAQVLAIDPYTPPLFNLIAWCWYRVVPYGELWLRLPSIAFVVGSVPLVAACGRRIGGRRTGFLAAFLLVINAKVFTQMGLTFRTYGLLLLLSTLLVYLQLRRMQTPMERFSWRLTAAAAATMLALGYTHYFGVLLACTFFAVDLYLLARGRLDGIRGKVFASYVVAVVGYLPWLAVVAHSFAHLSSAASSSAVNHWHDAAAAVNVHSLLYWLCGECAETLGLFHVAAIVVVVVGVYRCARHEFDWRAEMPLIVLLCSVVIMVGAVWGYSTFANPDSMLWVERYFTPLVPCIVLVSAWGTAKIFSWIPTSDPVRFVAAFLCVVLLVPTATGTVQNDLSEGSSTRFYAHLTEYLEQRPDISSDKTCVLALIDSTDRGRQISGWKHYYFDRKDTRDFKVTIWDGLDPSVIVNPGDLLQFDTIYVTRQHFDPELPDTYEQLFKRYYKKHRTSNPGWGETTYYVKIK